MKYGEGRSILACSLTSYQKRKLLGNLPKGAEYVKRAIKEFWKLDLQQIGEQEDDEEFFDYTGLGGESLWHNNRFEVMAPAETENFFTHTQ